MTFQRCLVGTPPADDEPDVPVNDVSQALWSDQGSATAETAVVLPSLAVVLLLALWAVTAAVAQLRCVDAAATGARALARDEPTALVVAAAETAGPPGARVRLARARETVTVTVDAKVGWPGSALSRLPALAVTAHATAAREDLQSTGTGLPAGLGTPVLGDQSALGTPAGSALPDAVGSSPAVVSPH